MTPRNLDGRSLSINEFFPFLHEVSSLPLRGGRTRPPPRFLGAPNGLDPVLQYHVFNLGVDPSKPRRQG